VKFLIQNFICIIRTISFTAERRGIGNGIQLVEVKYEDCWNTPGFHGDELDDARTQTWGVLAQNTGSTSLHRTIGCSVYMLLVVLVCTYVEDCLIEAYIILRKMRHISSPSCLQTRRAADKTTHERSRPEGGVARPDTSPPKQMSQILISNGEVRTKYSLTRRLSSVHDR